MGLSIPLSMEAVQESLRSQGRLQLQVSEKALLDQLATMGALVDRNNQPITPEYAGERTWKGHLDGEGVRFTRVPASWLPALGLPSTCAGPGLRLVGGVGG